MGFAFKKEHFLPKTLATCLKHASEFDSIQNSKFLNALK